MEVGDSDMGENSLMVFGFVRVESSRRQKPQDQSYCPRPTARTTPEARGYSGQDCAPGNILGYLDVLGRVWDLPTPAGPVGSCLRQPRPQETTLPPHQLG